MSTDPAPAPAPDRCPRCGGALVRLGGATLRTKAKAIAIEHFACEQCGKRSVRHSDGRVRETGVDLTAE